MLFLTLVIFNSCIISCSVAIIPHVLDHFFLHIPRGLLTPSGKPPLPQHLGFREAASRREGRAVIIVPTPQAFAASLLSVSWPRHSDPVQVGSFLSPVIHSTVV